MKARSEVTVAKNPILGAPKQTKVILRKSVCSVLVVLSIFVVLCLSRLSGVRVKPPQVAENILSFCHL